MAKPLGLKCPVCDGKVVLYLKRAGGYRCRRCGAEFWITKTGKGIVYRVTSSPLTTPKTFSKKVKK